jgi:hypothetical protein
MSCGKESIDKSQFPDTKSVLIESEGIKFYEKIYYKSFGSKDNKKGFAEIKIEYPELISNSNALDSINAFIKSDILNLSFNEDSYSSLDEIADSLFSNFISVQRDFPNTNYSWFLKCKITPTFSNSDLLSLKNESSVYTGGANSNTTITLTNFDLNNGKVIALEDIVEAENLSQLTKIGESIFKRTNDISNSYKDKGYWFENDVFQLNDNFIISDSGIVFIYNLYEIAPRSTGITSLFIPKEELTNIIKVFK